MGEIVYLGGGIGLLGWGKLYTWVGEMVYLDRGNAILGWGKWEIRVGEMHNLHLIFPNLSPHHSVLTP